ncbi:MAG: DUF4347 domain-containing protein, partial [Limnospira sp.]
MNTLKNRQQIKTNCGFFGALGSISNFKNTNLSSPNFREELVVVDTGIEDSSILFRGVLPGVKAIALPADQDGIRQITRVLQEHPDLDTLHIISHGFPGGLTLGNTQLNLDTLDEYADLLKRWRCDRIFLYGCNVAAGDAGSEFIEKLHNLTGAEIAASATPTGNPALGGNWKLEITTGNFEVNLAIDQKAIAAYPHVFPTFDWNNFDWPDGQLGTNTFANIDGSNIAVDMTVTAGPDIRLQPDALTNRLTPDDFPLFYGGADEPQIALNLFITDTPDLEGDGVTLTIDFSEPVQWVSFQTLDIDESNGGQWRDLITIKGSDDTGAAIDPTFIPSENPTYTISGTTITGANGDSRNNPGDDSARGTLTVFFTEPIQLFSLQYDSEFSSQVIHGVGMLNNFIFNPTITLTPTEISQVEGDSGTTDYEYTVTLSDALYVPLVVEYTTGDDTATAGEDYIANNGVLTFAPGETEKTITVQSIGDTTPELTEQFTVTLTSAEFQDGNGNPLGSPVVINDSAIGIIENDDIPPNTAPDAVNDTATTNEDTAVTINVLTNDSDPEGDDLEIAEVGIPSNGTVQIDDNGTPNDPTDDQIIFTPDPGFTGTASFEYTINDGNGGIDTATVTVTVTEPPNTAPEAVNDTATTQQNSILTFTPETLLENDTDPENDTLTLTEVGNPSNGTVELDTDGNVIFTPDPGFTGTASFEYTIND